ncbi:MAG: hypothetical protein J6Y71_10450 [Ruminococcus sp.]|nr:hypothetical protein [Ruminococcus sp.]
MKFSVKLGESLIQVPREVDIEVAERKLRFWEIEIDKLSPEQEEYLNSWQAE